MTTDVEDLLDRDEHLGSWRREVARLQAELRKTEAEKGEALKALAAAQKENKDLRGLIGQIAATAMVGAKA